jgi:hypothetical protein
LRSTRLRDGILIVIAAIVLMAVPKGAQGASGDIYARAVPRAHCGRGSDPETGIQGRVSAKDVASGRAARGYRCNTQLVSHYGASGGYRTYRYVDRAGHVCAYYDPTLIFPSNVASDPHNTGVVVLDMANPSHPVETTRLLSPAMQTPHESLNLHVKRGLLAAVLANPLTAPGDVDVYSVAADCRHPALESSLPVQVLGHEGTFSPDGRTFWSSSTASGLTAIDVSNPQMPEPLLTIQGIKPHGLNVSNDGNTLFYTDLSGQTVTMNSPPIDGIQGLTIMDVSDVQRRVLDPQVHVQSRLTWSSVAAPQTAIPITIHGHPYLAEVDEYANLNGSLSADPKALVGGARIIDIADLRRPRAISNIKLEVNTPKYRPKVTGDPGMSSNLQGYAGHYCAVPQRADPGILACTFILSGLRVFDIRDPYHPKEIAYFNAPVHPGGSNYAMSAPAFDPAHSQIWYTDSSSGFYAVRITNGVWPFRRRTR